MMLRIILKTLQKRNETGLVSQSTSRAKGKSANVRSFLPIDLYKSTRRERLNLYRCVPTPNAWPTWTSSN